MNFKNTLNFLNLFLVIYIFVYFTFNFGAYVSLIEIKDTLRAIFGYDFFWVDYRVVSIIFSLTSTILIYITLNSREFFESKKLYRLYALFAVNGLSMFFVFYLFKIFTMSRIYLLFLIFMIPAMVYLYISLSQKITIKKELFVFLIGVFGFIISLSSVPILDKPVSANTLIDDVPKNYNKLTRDYLLSPKLKMTKYPICCDEDSYFFNGKKPFGYISSFKDFIIFISGEGELRSYKKLNFTGSQELEEVVIKTNIKEVINNEYIFLKDDESIKDMIIVKDKIYVSYIEEKSANCVNVQILEANLNNVLVEFEMFFESEECVKVFRDEEKTHISGGALLNIDNENIYLTTGDFGDYSLAQDPNSIFGKVIKINLDNKSYKIVSLGHRNPQGLAHYDLNGYLIETEHGPFGGDEINIINTLEVENFGWPLASYGEHYDGTFKEEAPLYKSHANYNFKEPAFYINKNNYATHGISDVERNYFDEGLSYFVASMNAQRLHVVNFAEGTDKISDIYSYSMSNRIRDIEYVPEYNLYIFVLENPQSFGVLMLNK